MQPSHFNSKLLLLGYPPQSVIPVESKENINPDEGIDHEWESKQEIWVNDLISSKQGSTTALVTTLHDQIRAHHLSALEAARKKGKNNDEEVREHLKVLCEDISPNDPILWREYLSFEMHRLPYSSFQQLVQKALRFNPGSFEILFLHAELLCFRNDRPGLNQLISSLGKMKLKDTQKIYLCDVRLALKRGEYEHALFVLRAINKKIETPSAEVTKAIIYVLCLLNRFNEARDFIKQNSISLIKYRIDPVLLSLEINAFEYSLKLKGKHETTVSAEIELGKDRKLNYTVFEKAADIELSRENLLSAVEYYDRAYSECTDLYKYKILLKKARVHLLLPNGDKEIETILKELLENYSQQSFEINLEIAGHKEFQNKHEEALQIYQQLEKNTVREYHRKKLSGFLLQFYIRTNQLDEGIKASERILKEFPDNSWLVILMKGMRGDEDTLEFAKKYEEDSKRNGRYWCERARLHMNPFTPHFSLELAASYLEKTEFTSQYVDGYLEKLRLRLISVSDFNVGEAEFKKKLGEQYASIKNREGTVINNMYGVANLLDHPAVSFANAYNGICQEYAKNASFYTQKQEVNYEKSRYFHSCYPDRMQLQMKPLTRLNLIFSML